MNRYNSYEKKIREQRLINFKKTTLQLLALDYDVFEGGKGTFMYYFFHPKYNKVVIYPKSNKAFFNNQWINDMNDFLIKKIIK